FCRRATRPLAPAAPMCYTAGVGPSPRPARTDELAAAFRMIFGHLDEAACDRCVAHALFLLQRGEVDPSGLFVTAEDGLSGAVLCQPMPGAAALLWSPVSRPDVD